MHLGLTSWRTDHCAQALIEQAVFAEQLGYESFWLTEHHFSDNAIPDPLMLLASVAGDTHTIRLATASYLLPLRHPLHAAEQVSMLDQLSGGRLILGVGRGVGANMLRAFNVEPKDKRQRFERHLKIMINAWSGACIADADDPETGVVLHPLPVQIPHPPIWVAAFGPKALAQAGQLGLPYLASPLETIDDIKRNINLHNQACQESKQLIPTTRPILRTVFVSDDKKVVDTLRKRLSENNNASRWRDQCASLDDWAIIGDQQFASEKIAEYQKRLSMTHLIISHYHLGDLPQLLLRESLELISQLDSGDNKR
ncbi:MAG: hypothetical protein DRQ97_00320 [Gammaproteobacteria bacterium]|nr:MAG: hypothetical protein DRQ97_00320 [Gammaproteobacteria bacterium]